MMFRGGRRLAMLWTVTLSVLFGATLPSVSAAFGGRSGHGPGEICTVRADRSAFSEPGAGRHDPAPGVDPLLDHCPLCSLHLGHVGVPPALAVAPALRSSHAAYGRYIAAAPTLRVWSDARSRAPPAE